MCLCINPNCPQPLNSEHSLLCKSCDSELLINGLYRVTRFLGKGGFGTTYEVIGGSTAKVLKVLRDDFGKPSLQAKAIELFKREFQVLNHLNHLGVPKVKQDDFFKFSLQSSQSFLYCLVMEKIEGMDLEQWMKQRRYQPITEQLALRWIKQLVEILGEIHQRRFFHRDIKPSNIMLRAKDGQLTLIDFGGVKEFSITSVQQQTQDTSLSSPGYTPPEQMRRKAVLQSDFFALGRTFVYLLTGRQPNDLSESQDRCLIWRDRTSQISEIFLNLIDDLMAPNFHDRPQKAQEILDRVMIIEQAFCSQNQPIQLPKKTSNISSQPHIRLPFKSFWYISYTRRLSIIAGVATTLVLVLTTLSGLSYLKAILLSVLIGFLLIILVVLFQLFHRFYELIFRNF